MLLKNLKTFGQETLMKLISLRVLVATAALALSAPFVANATTDTTTVTVASPSGGGAYGAAPGSFGSISPSATSNGYTYGEMVTGVHGPVSDTIIAIGGFSSNPGQSWLTSVTCAGVVFTGSAASYNYSGGVAYWNDGSPALFTSSQVGTGVSCSVVHS